VNSKREFRVGQTASMEKIFAAEDIEAYANSTGDRNPIHLDSVYAAKTKFGRRVAHGMFVASMFSTIFGTDFPGEGTIYVGQSLKFLKPVFLGDKVRAVVELIKIHEGKPLATFKTVCVNQKGEKVIDGEALLVLP
jgi:acyl dehydratase